MSVKCIRSIVSCAFCPTPNVMPFPVVTLGFHSPVDESGTTCLFIEKRYFGFPVSVNM